MKNFYVLIFNKLDHALEALHNDLTVFHIRSASSGCHQVYACYDVRDAEELYHYLCELLNGEYDESYFVDADNILVFPCAIDVCCIGVGEDYLRDWAKARLYEDMQKSEDIMPPMSELCGEDSEEDSSHYALPMKTESTLIRHGDAYYRIWRSANLPFGRSRCEGCCFSYQSCPIRDRCEEYSGSMGMAEHVDTTVYDGVTYELVDGTCEECDAFDPSDGSRCYCSRRGYCPARNAACTCKRI